MNNKVPDKLSGGDTTWSALSAFVIFGCLIALGALIPLRMWCARLTRGVFYKEKGLTRH